MYTLYEYPPSGNSYKVKLLLSQMGVPFKAVQLNILKGESRTEEFTAKNPNGRIPVLELDDGRTLSESSAILWYLADGTDFLPDDKWSRAKVLQWLAFEQYNLEPNIAVARFHLQHGNKTEEELGKKLVAWRKGGTAALELLESSLEGRDYLVGDSYSIADIGLFGYTHVAEDGGFPLGGYPSILAWVERIKKTPDFVPIVSEWP